MYATEIVKHAIFQMYIILIINGENKVHIPSPNSIWNINHSISKTDLNFLFGDISIYRRSKMYPFMYKIHAHCGENNATFCIFTMGLRKKSL